jgi:hypothetical protein
MVDRATHVAREAAANAWCDVYLFRHGVRFRSERGFGSRARALESLARACALVGDLPDPDDRWDLRSFLNRCAEDLEAGKLPGSSSTGSAEAGAPCDVTSR